MGSLSEFQLLGKRATEAAGQLFKVILRASYWQEMGRLQNCSC